MSTELLNLPDLPAGSTSLARVLVAVPGTPKAKAYKTTLPTGGGGGGAVSSVAGRTGAVVLTTSDVGGLGNAATRTVGTTAGTVAAGDDSRIVGALTSALANLTYAPLANAALTGTPTVPTATYLTSTTQAASTAYVRAAIEGPRRTVTTSPASIATSDDGGIVWINKSPAGATAITLPSAPRTGFRVSVADDKGDAATNNITVSPAAGGSINGSGTKLIDDNYEVFTFEHRGADVWRIV